MVIKEREYGKDHRELASTLHSLGDAHGHLGHHKERKELLKRALVIKEREYGKDHRELASTLESLGNAHGALGHHKERKELLERALVIKEREYGKDHRELANTLESLGNAHGALGHHKDRKELLKRALVIKEREYGKDHLETAITLANLSNVYQSLGDIKGAKELLEKRVLPIFKQAYEIEHPYMGKVKSLLDECNKQLSVTKIQQTANTFETKSSKETERNLKASLRKEHWSVPDKMSTELKSEKKEDKESKDLASKTRLLCLAASKNNILGMVTLLKEGVDPNTPFQQGFTAMHYACERGHVDAILLLEKYSGKTDLVNNKGKTPLQYLSESISAQYKLKKSQTKEPKKVSGDKLARTKTDPTFLPSGGIFADVTHDASQVKASAKVNSELEPLSLDKSVPLSSKD